ncbi:unnamed protein product [Chondrus crispus]|uniref:Replication termination factor 2 n=1 Tax=Chondrus crispus TaxID=2769 RepID=R7QHZ7_CHOCR|nr:unnamed protein product [Chondrus crispus]CDF37086.1 unnamed protein product [Chondrus crispus]|eukprot:XP_005716905.1 unnamed protein product [Chondrus crispus]
MRAVLYGKSTRAADTSRASVTHCALSKTSLRPPHVVVDRAGNLYNKDALLHYVLARRARKGPATAEGEALAHIRSIKRDTARVQCGADGLVCPVTRKVASEGGGFGVGWECGCVTARVNVEGVRGKEGEGEEGGREVNCVACQAKGSRVRLGLRLEDRLRVLEEGKLREGKRKRKRMEKEGTGSKSKLARLPSDASRHPEQSAATFAEN